MQEIINARADIKSAYSAGASIYVPMIYYNAEVALKKAEINLKKRNFNESRIQAKNTIRLAKKARELSVEHISSLKSRVFGEIVAAEKICKHFIKHNKKEFTKIQQVREKLNSAYEAFDREDYMIAREKVFEIVTICRSGMPSKKTSKVKIKDKVKICNKKPTVFYKVKKGDCLINIAKDKKIFDDPWLWLLIYKANRDQIRNPHYIYVGQKLFIPRNVQPADISSIRREAKSLIKNQQ